MTASPAERFARNRTERNLPTLRSFQEGLGFELDPFQRAACTSLEQGSSVLVAAPTGAGKTVVAEFAVALALRDPHAKIFYTAPIKALSNQKYREFVSAHGSSEVGLLTGDTNINSQARVLVMTTEVLRNMLYAGSDLLDDLAYVVMDEVHYLADRARGAVWEEVLIHLPSEVRLVALSATVSNAEEFGDWLQTIRGETDVIVSEHRPTPLYQHVLVGGRFHDLFRADRGRGLEVNPELAQVVRVATGGSRGRGRGRRSDSRSAHAPALRRPGRGEVVRMLDDMRLLPAICFIFSRAGCDEAVEQVLRSGIVLTTPEEREEIRWIVDERTRNLRDEELAVLGFYGWRDSLERGVASHHAGLLPAFKVIVEELFQQRLLKVVFATETLALGINMPARTVVLERLDKFNGVSRVPITPGEYTQLTGRAGRRGIDDEGHAVVVWRPGMLPDAISNLASRRSYPLNSSFRPTYNMAVNLIGQFGVERTRAVLESSFAQFQADRAVLDLARTARQQREALAGYAESVHCDRGDFLEYSGLRRALSDAEKQKIVADAPGAHAAREQRNRTLSDLRAALKAHPCHACPKREDHARWAERYWRLERDTVRIERQISERTGAIARVFDRLSALLLERGYLRADADGELALTTHGSTLRRIYGERDLLVAECIRRQVWLELDAPQLAAMAAALVYEPRRDSENPPEARLPGKAFREAVSATDRLWAELDELEEKHRVPRTEPLATGLARGIHRWASGVPLDRVLIEAELAAGDFVRWSKQVLDLLDQIASVATGRLSVRAREAYELVRRDIVADTGTAE